MKKKFILTPLIGGLLYVMLSSYATGPGLNGIGDRTGATASTSGCSESGGGCHATSATASTTISIQLYDVSGTTLITSGYVGSTSYTIRITGTNTGATNLPRFGFQVSAVKTGSTSVNEGSFSTPPVGTHAGTYGGINIVEHSSALPATSLVGSGSSGTTYVVNIPWSSPAGGSGSVTIYSALNAVNYNMVQDAGDLWNLGSLVVPENSSTGPITGTTTLCIGATTTLTDATTGGTWSSGHTAVATVGATTGVVTGIAAGTAVISYNAAGGVATTVVTVMGVPAPAAITGSSIICVDKTTPLADVTTGGTWTSSITADATVDATTGVVTGVAVGSTIISYTVTTACGTGSVGHAMSIHAVGTCAAGVAQVQNQAIKGLTVYPNPNDGSFTVNLLSDEDEQVSVIITNIAGGKVKEWNTVTNRDVNIKLQIPSGIYFISASTADGRYVSKMFVN